MTAFEYDHKVVIREMVHPDILRQNSTWQAISFGTEKVTFSPCMTSASAAVILPVSAFRCSAICFNVSRRRMLKLFSTWGCVIPLYLVIRFKDVIAPFRARSLDSCYSAPRISFVLHRVFGRIFLRSLSNGPCSTITQGLLPCRLIRCVPVILFTHGEKSTLSETADFWAIRHEGREPISRF